MSEEGTSAGRNWLPGDLQILYRDAILVAIHKPAGMLVHRTHLEAGDAPAALQLVRDRVSRYVYPCHRLDRPTSGILVFALEKPAARQITRDFENREVEKEYLAVVRGWPDPEAGLIDRPLKPKGKGYLNREGAEPKDARTAYATLATTELPIALKAFPTARYSLVEARPLTGRLHQIRRHLKHLNHPIIGDTRHGDGEHNRLFRDHFQCNRLLLAATRLALHHPITGRKLNLECPPAADMNAIIERLGWRNALPEALRSPPPDRPESSS